MTPSLLCSFTIILHDLVIRYPHAQGMKKIHKIEQVCLSPFLRVPQQLLDSYKIDIQAVNIREHAL